MVSQEVSYMELKKRIENAECILVGIGDEFSIKNILGCKDLGGGNEEPEYNIINSLGIKNRKDLEMDIHNSKLIEYIEVALKKIWYKDHKEELVSYHRLVSLLDGKNYFIISSNTDEGVYLTGVDETRIVAPFGNEKLFQCSDINCKEIWNNDVYFETLVKQLPEIVGETKDSKSVEYEKYLPVCPTCGKSAILNVRKDADTYNENGYLTQWANYLGWVQRTLNKNLLILELGENFSNPKIIRWPFENMTMLNNKAFLIRVNEVFAQIPEEIKGKAISIQENAAEWIKNS